MTRRVFRIFACVGMNRVCELCGHSDATEVIKFHGTRYHACESCAEQCKIEARDTDEGGWG